MIRKQYDLICTNVGPSDLLEIVPDTDRRAYIKRCMRAVTVSGVYAEFGVARGVSARIILEDMPAYKKLWLFDSFEGLPEEWLGIMPKGHFKCEVPVFSPQETILVKGLFEDTLKEWAPRIEDLALLHIDSDLYSSAKTVLDYLAHAIVPGTIIMFDELFGFKGWEEHEYKAWLEHCKKWDIHYEWIARTGHNTRRGRDNYKAALVVC